MLAIRRVNKHAAFFLIDTRDLTHNYGCILLFPQYSTDRRADLPGSEHRCRHLIKQWLKQMMIRPIDENIDGRRFAESLRRGETAEPTAYYHNTRGGRFLWINSARGAAIRVDHSFRTYEGALIKALRVPLDADLSGIAARDEDEIGDGQRKTHRPPNGSEM